MVTCDSQGILDSFEDFGLTLFELLQGLLETNLFEDRPLVESLAGDIPRILQLFKLADATSIMTTEWVFCEAEYEYKSQVLKLTKKESGFHFVASKTTNAQLIKTCIYILSKDMQHHAPDLWKLLGVLHIADPVANQKRAERAYKKARSATRTKEHFGNGNGDGDGDGGITMADATSYTSEDEDWGFLDSNKVQLIGKEDGAPENLSSHLEEQFSALAKILRAVVSEPVVEEK